MALGKSGSIRSGDLRMRVLSLPLPQAFGEDTRDFLITEGYSVEWKTYDMPHAVCPEEIGDVRRWLQTVFKG